MTSSRLYLNYPYILFLIASLLLAFIVASCDRPTSTTEPEQQQLLDLPEYGVSALPQPQVKPGKQHLQEGSPVSPLYAMLADYARQHPDDPYVAVVGVWNTEKQQYKYRTIPLQFSDSIRTEVNDKKMYYKYILRGENGKVIRNLASLAPRHAVIPTMMKRWLHPANLEAKKSESNGSKSDKSWISSDGMECVSIPGYGYYCWFTEDLVVTAAADDSQQLEGDNGSGGSWPSDDNGGCPLSGCGSSGGGSGSSGPPATAPDGVPQDYYDQLNDVEKQICYDNKYKCIGVYHASVFAREWAQENEPALNGHNDARDALRHTMWSAKMAYAYGEEYAKKWGDAHEIGSVSAAETHMDQHNNQVGRSIGGPAGRNLTYFPDVEQDILDARDNGDLCLNLYECN